MVYLTFDEWAIYVHIHEVTTNKFYTLIDELKRLPEVKRTYLPIRKCWRIDRGASKLLENILCRNRYLGALAQLLDDSAPIETLGL